MRHLDQLARLSEHPENLTRLSFTPEHRQAVDTVAGWMEAAGMQVRIDDVGNVIGRYEGLKADAPTLMTGSHLDTVRDGGRYDGMLGVTVPIACIQQLHDRDERLPVAVEIVGFCDEEGVRFPSTLLGSRAMAGTLPQAALQETDANGVSMQTALEQFGIKQVDLARAKIEPGSLRAFVEMHIEQGPVLQQQNLPVGVVTAISSAARYQIELRGKAGHAGTVPMTMRQDALAAAAEGVLAIEKIALDTPGAVATVGSLRTLPGAGNVIPGHVNFLIDVRHADEHSLTSAEQQITAQLGKIAENRNIDLSVERYYDSRGVTCDADLTRELANAIEAEGHQICYLPSGAGHDTMAMAAIAPVAMLFVRCKDGISHNPAESITADDAGRAARVMLRFLRGLKP